MTRAPATSLVLNAIGRVEIEAAQAVAFDAYAENRQTGAFILIDRSTLRTAAAGMVVESLDTAPPCASPRRDGDAGPARRGQGRSRRWSCG